MTNPFKDSHHTEYNRLVASTESTVVAEYTPIPRADTAAQTESALENELVKTLVSQGYERVYIDGEKQLLANLRTQVERLNQVSFTDPEWDRFVAEFVSPHDDTVLSKTKRIQHEGAVYTFTFDDGHLANIRLIDFDTVHNNYLQVMNQYRVTTDDGAYTNNRYDVTILLNGLPIVHIELKRRGKSIQEAFHQINRYGRESFSTGTKLFDYVHIFVISNGTLTKYYSNTTRLLQVKSAIKTRTVKTSTAFEFTMWWADGKNKRITDLTDFTRTFLARRTLFNLITRYCVLDTNNTLLVMRPYQVIATERILAKIKANINYPQVLGTVESRGYIWHTTGSGKTLTSFKTAQLATELPEIAKVIFVVDRQDLDYQTMKEYDKFAKGAANGNSSTSVLKRQLADENARIIVTTIQKLNHLTLKKEKLDIFNQHVVFIFDECHRSQFGSMHKNITKTFKKTSMFGFTGTPIFHTPEDEARRRPDTAIPDTTESKFGALLHRYTIVNAISDGNVLPFNVQTFDTMRAAVGEDSNVPGIDTEKALLAPQRITEITSHILDNFAVHTKRSIPFSHTVQDYNATAHKKGLPTPSQRTTVNGFNAMLATSSITAARAYYDEFKAQMATLPESKHLKVATIFSTPSAEKEENDLLLADGFMGEEDMTAATLKDEEKQWLSAAVADYNTIFGCQFDLDTQDGFQNYYRDLSQRIKNRELDVVIVVNMFLTGFDATTLNTLYVDKNLRRHGLIQAFSRTNRILNKEKVAGNIVCYRNLEEQIRDAMSRFGDDDAYNVSVLKPYATYLEEYHATIDKLHDVCAPGDMPTGDQAEAEFIKLYSALLRLINVLDMFEEFGHDTYLSKRDMQDYQSVYVELYENKSRDKDGKVVDISEDLEFEIHLVNRMSVGVDYIVQLVIEMVNARDGMTDEDRARIRREVNASAELRKKSDLIDEFIRRVQGDSTTDDFYAMTHEAFNKELRELIVEFNLSPIETHVFVTLGLANGGVSASGIGAASIMPPVRRFGGAKSANNADLKHHIISRINQLIERFADVVDPSALVTEQER